MEEPSYRRLERQKAGLTDGWKDMHRDGWRNRQTHTFKHTVSDRTQLYIQGDGRTQIDMQGDRRTQIYRQGDRRKQID
jgi:hypothetical protein